MAVRPRSCWSTNVHRMDRMTANDSQVWRGSLSAKKVVVGTSENGWRPSPGFPDRLRSRAPRASSYEWGRTLGIARDNRNLSRPY